MEKALSPVSADQFKAVMKRFAATVNVITSANDGILNGMTATAVCSVSADPPTVLTIVNRSNRSYPIIKNSGAFAINVLSEAQELLAVHFASKAENPFSTIEHRVGETGCPILKNTDAHLECRVVSEVEVGTHTIFIGEVVSSNVTNRDPLLYHAGHFCALERHVVAA